MIITDQMAPTMHPCDGKYYDSKSEYARVTAAHNSFEVGDNFNREDYEREKRYADRLEDKKTDAEVDLYLQSIYDSCVEDEASTPFYPSDECKPYFTI